MRHIQIPDPVVLLMVVDEKGNPVLYDLKRLNMANVWNSSKWRDENKIEMCMRIADKFEATKYVPGTWVSLTDEEYEAYAPLATLKGEKLNPEMALDVMKVMKPIISAPHELPGDKPEQATEA
jgi:hypothetical protein